MVRRTFKKVPDYFRTLCIKGLTYLVWLDKIKVSKAFLNLIAKVFEINLVNV